MIKNIIFFNDFALYSACEIEAKKNGKNISDFIVESCINCLSVNNYPVDRIKKPIDLWVACDTVAKKLKTTVPQLMEDACRYAITPPEKKASFWDKLSLPKG